MFKLGADDMEEKSFGTWMRERYGLSTLPFAGDLSAIKL